MGEEEEEEEGEDEGKQSAFLRDSRNSTSCPERLAKMKNISAVFSTQMLSCTPQSTQQAPQTPDLRTAVHKCCEQGPYPLRLNHRARPFHRTQTQ